MMTIAVAVALYNGEKYIVEQMDSLRKQTRVADRVVLCDDGSTDETIALVEQYIKKYHLESSWELYKNPSNMGYIKNFYNAIYHCKEDIVFLCDQDDVWKLNKIEKMSSVMETHHEITLLSSRYDIIDDAGMPIQSIMHIPQKETKALRQIFVKDIMKAYQWPGMVMCIRKNFFEKISLDLWNQQIPHDYVFAICAADKGEFYQYDYVGAFHRRHADNTAKEEHRVTKTFKMKRKLSDIEDSCHYIINTLNSSLRISKDTKDLLETKLQFLVERKRMLEERNVLGILRLYANDKKKILRLGPLVGDIIMIITDRRGQYAK